jgi:hypothetical protein
MLDSLMRAKIDRARRLNGFENVSEEIRTLEFAETLGVGSTKIKKANIIDIN